MADNPAKPPQISKAMLWAAFITLYISWGSTYLAIRFALETMPPLLMGGARFLFAGGVLYLFSRMTGTPGPQRRQWWPASIIGALLLLGGNGGVVLAERTVPSGITALLVGATPFWMVLINWLIFRGVRPTWQIVVGLIVGFLGLYVLVGTSSSSPERIDPVGAALILFATLSWAAGSIYSKHAKLPDSPMLLSGMQMLTGGAMLFIAGLLHGELATFHIANVSPKSAFALAYLVFFGSLVGFSTYVYVLKHASAARASTYAYVNPVVAVLMGWAIANEPIGVRTLIAGAAILIAVVLITTSSSTPKPASAEPAEIPETPNAAATREAAA